VIRTSPTDQLVVDGHPRHPRHSGAPQALVTKPIECRRVLRYFFPLCTYPSFQQEGVL
jgi:hypothetical protein